MQIHLIVWALAFSLVSVTAAQVSPVDFSPPTERAIIIQSSQGTPSVFLGPSAAVVTVSSAHTTPTAFPGQAPVSRGPIVAAAVCGSIAVTLIVLAEMLFCTCFQACKTQIVEMDSAGETKKRCADLENQVFELRAQLDRLERSVHGIGAIYTHEEAEALGMGGDTAVKTSAPPTYAD
ncbi:hypothetical protein DFH09DRAFT_1325548 [Mycena vulgaris]|nr:hypothetical protein DFH09DRAFT_1325548 [Mycena vulgaris]